ncbi:MULTISPECIES: ATP-binding cassette domain-containing protein [Cellulomonas]|uniref:ATP-binding cassette domain-containing protein n=1 Tax=Cellulomonas TaxID=1707 RepID=UPI0014562A1C|nr:MULTISPECIES: ATP-binding cassette domain-containing protein [Cellulomonas]
MSSTRAVLTAIDVRAGYGGPAVLDGIHLTLRTGDAVGLLGRSGVGKSTLVEILGGHMRPGAGRVTLDGVDVSKPPLRQRKLVKARLRTVHQNGLAGIDPQRTVERTMEDAFTEARKAGRSTNHDVEAALGVVGLPIRFVTRTVRSLSGGERQRVAIARALAAKPDLLLLDEPLTAVDQAMREEVAADIRALVREDGIGLLVASHDVRLLDRLTDTVHVLADGRLVESAPLRQLLRDPQHPDTRALVEALPEAVAGSRALTD